MCMCNAFPDGHRRTAQDIRFYLRFNILFYLPFYIRFYLPFHINLYLPFHIHFRIHILLLTALCITAITLFTAIWVYFI